MQSQAAGRPVDEQRDGARDMQNKVRYETARGTSEDGTLNGFGLTQWAGSRVLRNPSPNAQPFPGRLPFNPRIGGEYAPPPCSQSPNQTEMTQCESKT